MVYLANYCLGLKCVFHEIQFIVTKSSFGVQISMMACFKEQMEYFSVKRSNLMLDFIFSRIEDPNVAFFSFLLIFKMYVDFDTPSLCLFTTFSKYLGTIFKN